MDTVLRYRGREIRNDQVAFIQTLLAGTPRITRRALSFRVCEAWDWRQPNGQPCDVVCRGLLLQLHRAGHIQLPEPQWRSARPRRHRVVEHIEIEPAALDAPLGQLGPIEIRQVRRTPDEELVKSLVAQFHYLGYTHPVGEHLKYLMTAQGRPIACMCLSSAPRHLGPRDRHIGWSKEARRANVRFIAYQSRFLILPWVKVPHLASHLLGTISRRLSRDWETVYSHPIYYTETFVDETRYRGTCYRAANWTPLGLTTGRGKADSTKKPNRSLKQVWGYALVKDFRKRLCALQEPVR
jgi:hypothetical protein